MKVQNASSCDSRVLSFYLLPWTQLPLAAAGFLAAKSLFCKIYNYFREKKSKYQFCISTNICQYKRVQNQIEKYNSLVVTQVAWSRGGGGALKNIVSLSSHVLGRGPCELVCFVRSWQASINWKNEAPFCSSWSWKHMLRNWRWYFHSSRNDSIFDTNPSNLLSKVWLEIR